MDDHASLPLICDNCMERFLADVVANETDRKTGALCWCPHHATLALALVNKGYVVSWVLQSPTTEEDVREHIAQLEQQGAPPWATRGSRKH